MLIIPASATLIHWYSETKTVEQDAFRAIVGVVHINSTGIFLDPLFVRTCLRQSG